MSSNSSSPSDFLFNPSCLPLSREVSIPPDKGDIGGSCSAFFIFSFSSSFKLETSSPSFLLVKRLQIFFISGAKSSRASNIIRIEIIKIAPRKIILAYMSNRETRGVDKISPKNPPACLPEAMSIIPSPASRNIIPLMARIHPIFGVSDFTNETPSKMQSSGSNI